MWWHLKLDLSRYRDYVFTEILSYTLLYIPAKDMRVWGRGNSELMSLFPYHCPFSPDLYITKDWNTCYLSFKVKFYIGTVYFHIIFLCKRISTACEQITFLFFWFLYPTKCLAQSSCLILTDFWFLNISFPYSSIKSFHVTKNKKGVV